MKIIILLLFLNISTQEDWQKKQKSQIHNPHINEEKFEVGPSINVKSFGAKGSGNTNDHPAIQEAFDSLDPNTGGTIFFPEGEYLLNDGITIESKNNILVTGEPGAILIVNNINMFVLHFIGAEGIEGENRPQNVRVENITFIDPDPEKHTDIEESHGVRFAGYDNVEVRNSQFIDIGDEGIEFTRCRWAWAYNNLGEGTPSIDPGGAFIQSSNSRYVKILNNEADGSQFGTSFGVRTPTVPNMSPKDIEISNNISTNSQGNGIRILTTMDDVSEIKIKDNIIINSALEGINFVNLNDKKTTKVEITGNLIDGGGNKSSSSSVRAAILLRSSLVSNVNITDNDIRNWGDKNTLNHYGIAYRGDEIKVLNNKIKNTPGAGIFQLSGNDSEIARNLVSGSVHSSGILIRSGTNIIVNDNISEINFSSGIKINNDVENYSISKNSVSDNDIGIFLMSRTAPLNFESNLFVNNIIGLDSKNVNELVDARFNWWNDISGPSGGIRDPLTKRIANGFGNRIAGKVKFDPWLESLSENEQVDGLTLEQNYPNPFNSNTIIVYHLAITSDVQLEVFDIIGRQVAVLVNEQKPNGVHMVNFDASQLSSGIYFYRIHSEEFMDTKKMLLIK